MVNSLRPTSKDEEKCNGLIEKEQDPSIKYIYIDTKHFQHYLYVNNLAKNCELRLEKVIRDTNRRKCVADQDVMIGIVGNHTVDNLNLLSKVNEEQNMRKKMFEINLESVPLLCFQNDLQPESALKILRRENARHKILVQSDVPFDKTCKADVSIIIVGQNKRRLKEIITSCLEEQLDQMLQDWLGKLKHEDLNKQTSEIIAEIEAIRKQLILDSSNNTAAPGESCIANKSIVPNDVKNYRFRRFDVEGFGTWGCSTVPFFLNEEILKKEEKHTMRQYDSTSLM